MLPTYNTRNMFRHPDGTFSAEISEMSAGGHRQVFGQVFPDSCDEGLLLVSHHSGREVRMVVTKTVRDKDGDLTHWCLRSLAEDERKFQLPYAIELTIFND